MPDIEDLDLKAAGIDYDQKKAIKVNEFLQSVSNPVVYAPGDVPVGSMTRCADYYILNFVVDINKTRE